jgi:hypothetical protein
MEDSNKLKFEEKFYFSDLNLKSYLGDDCKENEKIFVCGKMYDHPIISKHQFKACEFLIYLPRIKKLFHSEMESLDCFSNSLKWTLNFFKKIRLCLDTPEGVKNTYFSINYEQKKDEKNGMIIDLESETLPSTINHVQDEDLSHEFTERKIYLELHFLVESQDIIAFRLRLDHILEDKPEMVIMNKFLEYEKLENEKLLKKQEKSYELEKEICKMEKEISLANENLEKRKKQYVYKFYYLNKEKSKKINELSTAIKKEKKLLV